MHCIWLTTSNFSLVLFPGVRRDSRSIFGAISFQKFRPGTCLSSYDKLAVCCGFDFEIYGAADTWEILCWPNNVYPQKRNTSGSGLHKRFSSIRLYQSIVRDLARATQGRVNARVSVPSVAGGGRARVIVGGDGRLSAGSEMSGEIGSTAGESGSMRDSISAAKFVS